GEQMVECENLSPQQPPQTRTQEKLISYSQWCRSLKMSGVFSICDNSKAMARAGYRDDLDQAFWEISGVGADQPHLETTMQSNIHLHQIGRTKKQHDPTLPLEQATATRIGEITFDSQTPDQLKMMDKTAEREKLLLIITGCQKEENGTKDFGMCCEAKGATSNEWPVYAGSNQGEEEGFIVIEHWRVAGACSSKRDNNVRRRRNGCRLDIRHEKVMMRQ
ncbi:hypothetical protein Tco_1337005, partial [Tanacetum coccineum]